MIIIKYLYKITLVLVVVVLLLRLYGRRYDSLLSMVNWHPDIFYNTVLVDRVCRHVAVKVQTVGPFDLHHSVLWNFDERYFRDVSV